jgi:hypothetical protein
VDINCSSSLTLLDSTVVGNSADRGGGGIDDNTTGTVTMVRSLVSGNTAKGTVAGTPVDGGGGIAVNTGASLLAVDSTFTGNSAAIDGGAIAVAGNATATLVNDTIAGNTATGGTTVGGVFSMLNGTVNAGNTIVAKNTTANCGGAVTDKGNDLENGTSCGFATKAVNGDPKLGPLQANGGPTKTMALLPGSPALFAASDTTCTAAITATPPGAGGLDQRGAKRPQGAHCDIGAFEVVATTTTLSAPSTATTATTITLTATVTPAQAIPGQPAGTVTFLDNAVSLDSAALSGSQPDTATLTTSTLAAGQHTLTAQFAQTPLFLGSTSSATVLSETAPAQIVAPPAAGADPDWTGGGAMIASGGLLLVAWRVEERRRRRET